MIDFINKLDIEFNIQATSARGEQYMPCLTMLVLDTDSPYLLSNKYNAKIVLELLLL